MDKSKVGLIVSIVGAIVGAAGTVFTKIGNAEKLDAAYEAKAEKEWAKLEEKQQQLLLDEEES